LGAYSARTASTVPRARRRQRTRQPLEVRDLGSSRVCDLQTCPAGPCRWRFGTRVCDLQTCLAGPCRLEVRDLGSSRVCDLQTYPAGPCRWRFGTSVVPGSVTNRPPGVRRHPAGSAPTSPRSPAVAWERSPPVPSVKRSAGRLPEVCRRPRCWTDLPQSAFRAHNHSCHNLDP
jgi:hypothetical protein